MYKNYTLCQRVLNNYFKLTQKINKYHPDQYNLY